MKNFALRLYDPEAEALERLAIVENKSKNEIINNLIARAYCELDEMSGQNPITDRLAICSAEEMLGAARFFEGVLLKALDVHNYDEPLTEYKREDLEGIAKKDPEKIPELYRAVLFSIAAANMIKQDPEATCNGEEPGEVLKRLNYAKITLEHLYNKYKHNGNEGY